MMPIDDTFSVLSLPDFVHYRLFEILPYLTRIKVGKTCKYFSKICKRFINFDNASDFVIIYFTKNELKITNEDGYCKTFKLDNALDVNKIIESCYMFPTKILVIKGENEIPHNGQIEIMDCILASLWPVAFCIENFSIDTVKLSKITLLNFLNLAKNVSTFSVTNVEMNEQISIRTEFLPCFNHLKNLTLHQSCDFVSDNQISQDLLNYSLNISQLKYIFVDPYYPFVSPENYHLLSDVVTETANVVVYSPSEPIPMIPRVTVTSVDFFDNNKSFYFTLFIVQAIIFCCNTLFYPSHFLIICVVTNFAFVSLLSSLAITPFSYFWIFEFKYDLIAKKFKETKYNESLLYYCITYFIWIFVICVLCFQAYFLNFKQNASVDVIIAALASSILLLSVTPFFDYGIKRFWILKNSK